MSRLKGGQEKDMRLFMQNMKPCNSMMEAKDPKQHHGMQSITHHGSNEKDGSLLDLEVKHKCDKLAQQLKDGGGSTLCTT